MISDGGKRSYVKTGEQSGSFTFEHDLLGPAHEIGTFTGAIKIVCGISLRCEVEQASLLDFKLHVSW